MGRNLVFVTGASSDIGVAFLRRVLQRDPEAVVVAHSYTGGGRIATLGDEFGIKRVRSLTADLSQTESAATLAAEVLCIGVPKVLVHLPALQLQYERFTKLDWDAFGRDLAVQVQSAGVLLQHMLPKMAKLEGARVLFVLSSVTIGVPPKFLSGYTVIKYAQLGLMRALASEYAGTHVRINGISPSMIHTQFLAGVAELVRESSAMANPMKRNASTEDLLAAMELLVSDGAEYIHGVALPITGGGAF